MDLYFPVIGLTDGREGSREATKISREGAEVRTKVSRESIQSSDGVGQAMCLTHFLLAADGGWFASKDVQVANNFGLPGEDVGINTGQILLRERVGGDGAGQSGGDS